MYLKGSVSKRKGETRERSTMCWFTPLMAETARLVPREKPGARNSIRVPAGTQSLGPSSTGFRGTSAGSWNLGQKGKWLNNVVFWANIHETQMLEYMQASRPLGFLLFQFPISDYMTSHLIFSPEI